MNRKKLIITRNKRKNRVRGKLKSKSSLPRLVITRSLNHISAQVIDLNGNVQLEVTSKNQSFKGKTKTEQATEIGKIVAEKLTKKKITAVVLDRGSYKYHGRIKALSEAVKSSGINI
jgi:large subunit ribosomal protein L18